MTANELVTKAMRKGYDQAVDGSSNLDDWIKTISILSAGLVVLTEERLKEIIEQAFLDGGWESEPHENQRAYSLPYASRIMREVKGGE